MTPSSNDTRNDPTTRNPTTGQDHPAIPSGNDPATIPCPVCATAFIPAGKRRYCRDACRVAAHRRRTQTTRPPTIVPDPPPPRRPHTIYQCDRCDTRQLGEQRCEDCGTFMHRLGYGGLCPCCDEPITTNELLTNTPT
jgi:hypothetical protein